MIWTIIALVILLISAFVLSIDAFDHDMISFIAVIMIVLSLIAALCMGITAISENTRHDRKLAALQAEREALVYQVEHNLYLGDAVGKFNSELINSQFGHEDPWTSWFYGSYWMEVDPIEFND